MVKPLDSIPKKTKPRMGRKKRFANCFSLPPLPGLFRFVILPTVAPWATFGRASGAFLAAMILFCVAGAAAETTNTLSDAEIQGRKLARQLCEAQPAENYANTGILKIRSANGDQTNFPIKFEVIVTSTNWLSVYEVTTGPSNKVVLEITHDVGLTNHCFFYDARISGGISVIEKAMIFGNGSGIMMNPFASSDFWLCDLGLDFFHWPAQKILPKKTNLVRGREYTLLESTNPNLSTNGYSRVLSSIDKETGGIWKPKRTTPKMIC